MKNIYKILACLAFSLVAFTACSDDDSPKYDTNTPTASGQFASTSEKTYVLEEDKKYETFEEYTWSASGYGDIAVGMRYTLQIDFAGNNFASPVDLGTYSDREATFMNNDINDALATLGATPLQETTIELRIVTKAYGGDGGTQLLETFPVIYSEPITLKVTPFEPVAPQYPATLYMIGAEFGNWDWESNGIAEMIPVNGKEGEFWCIRYFSANEGFKWAPEKKWANDFAQLDEIIGYTLNGNDAVVSSNGLYMVYVDMVKGKIAIEQAQVFGIGDAFGGWTEGTYPATISGQEVKITATNSADLRIYAGSSIATSDWWTREFILRNGVIEYRGNGGDQEPRIPISAGQTVTLNFNTGTGTIN